MPYTLEQLENGEVGNRIITIRCKDNRKFKHRIHPKKKDIPYIPEIDKVKYVYIPSLEDFFDLEDGVTINLDNPREQDMWKWIKNNSILAHSLEELMHTPEATFYVEIPEEEANIKLGDIDLLSDALVAAKNLKDSDYERIARRLNFEVSGMSQSDKRLTLLNFAKDKPARFLRAINAIDGVILDLINEGISKQVIDTKNISKYGSLKPDYSYHWRGNSWMTMDSLIAWLQDSRNTVEINELKVAITGFASFVPQDVLEAQEDAMNALIEASQPDSDTASPKVGRPKSNK